MYYNALSESRTTSNPLEIVQWRQSKFNFLEGDEGRKDGPKTPREAWRSAERMGLR